MTKEQEIKILKDVAERLGDNTYCGVWLKNILPGIESSIQSDLDPSVYTYTPHSAYVRVKELLEENREFAKKILETAHIEKAKIIKDGMNKLNYEACKIAKMLRDLADKLE